jgi:hypothetical protein
MLKVKILAKGKFTLSKKREVILVASSIIGTAALMYLLPERCCCGMSAQGQISSDKPQNTEHEDPETGDESNDYCQITAQDCGITSNMTFGQAFAHARTELGRGAVFAWHGKLYNTFYKEEWLAMSLEERQEFMNCIDFSYVPADDLPANVRDSNDNHLDNNDLNNNNSNHNDSHGNDSHHEDSHGNDSHHEDSHGNDSHHEDSHGNDSHHEDSHDNDSQDDNSHDDNSHDNDAHHEDAHQDDSNHQTIGGDTEGSDEHLIHLPEDPTGLFESHTPPADEPVKPEDLTHLSDNPDYNDHAGTGGMEYFH